MDPKDKYHFFWSGIFSQWCYSSFTVGGKTYNCCEQWMMASKAKLFGDTETLAKIMKARSPRKQKKLGRQVRGFDAKTWDRHKRNIVFMGNLYRAKQNPDFKKTLLATGDKQIVEASPYDRIWGIGFRESDALANKSRWGQNLLGKELMRVRETLSRQRKD